MERRRTAGARSRGTFARAHRRNQLTRKSLEKDALDAYRPIFEMVTGDSPRLFSRISIDGPLS